MNTLADAAFATAAASSEAVAAASAAVAARRAVVAAASAAVEAAAAASAAIVDSIISLSTLHALGVDSDLDARLQHVVSDAVDGCP